MARPAKPGNVRAGMGDTPRPYTEQQRKIYEFANTKRAVRSGGVTERLTNVDIMLRKQFEAGVSGKTLAQRDYLRQAQLAELARREHIEAECVYWSHVKARQQKAIDQAPASKAAIPQVFPHPDDILIDWDSGVRLPGPINEAEWKRFADTVHLRDALYLQQAMEDGVNGIPAHDRPTLGAAGLLAVVLNTLLPPSLRHSQHEWIMRVEQLTRGTKRDLLLECRAAWKAAGARVARGKQFGTREKLEPMLYAIRDMVDAYPAREEDPQGYDAAIHATALATEEFRRSAPKPKPMAGIRKQSENLA